MTKQARIHLMSRLVDLSYLCRERLSRVGRYIPRCLDVVLIQKFQESIYPNRCSKNSSGDIDWICIGAIPGIDPIMEVSGPFLYYSMRWDLPASCGVNVNPVPN